MSKRKPQVDAEPASKLKVFRLTNADESITFVAESIQIAAIVALCISRDLGAHDVEDDEWTPLIVFWDGFLDRYGIDGKWVTDHALQIADALETLMMLPPDERAELEDTLAALPSRSRKTYLKRRIERMRASLHPITCKALERAQWYRQFFYSQQREVRSMNQVATYQPTTSRVILVPIEVNILDMNGEKIDSRVLRARVVVPDLLLGQDAIAVALVHEVEGASAS